MQKLSKWILNISGWKAFSTVDEPSKSVICVAPHTSNWDFLIGELSYWSIGRKSSFLMKKSWFIFPLKYLLSALGGVAVDRSKSNSITQQMVEEFEKREYFHLAITPEGTRSLVTNWKMGFYYIALNAKIPIQLAYIDYAKKELAIKELFYPTGDEAKDFAHIQDYYKDIQARFPEKFNLSNTNRKAKL